MNVTEEPEALRRLAEEAARAGGAVAARHLQTGCHVRLKADRSEVSEADEAAQAAAIATLRAARPQDWIIAEEELPDGIKRPVRASGNSTARGERAVGWIIDPIDGTRNFIRGLPEFACAVAAVIADQPVAGAIFQPVGARLYSAALGGAAPGLYADGVAVSRPAAGEWPGMRSGKRVVAIPSTATGAAAALAHACLDRHVVRNVGATTLHLVSLALGHYDGVLIGDSRLWDVAAGWVLVRAAGGVMTTLGGTPLFPLDMAAYDGAPLPCLAATSSERLAELLAAGGS